MVSIYRFVCASILLLAHCKTTVSCEKCNLTILPKSPICLAQGQEVTLTCAVLSLANTRSWSLLWYHNGLQLTNVTIIHHTNYSITSRFVAKDPGLVTCVLTGPSQNASNASVSIEIRPNPVTSLIATPKFISDEDKFRYVKVSWLRQGFIGEYSVFFQIDLHGCFSMPCVDENIEATCDETKCTALLDTYGNDLSELLFHIVTREGACETTSKVWYYNLTLASCGGLPPKTLFYVPFSPTKLEIETSYRRVTMKWQDILVSLPPTVLVTYNCSQISTIHITQLERPGTRIIHLLGKHIRGYAPYGTCTFCLSVQEYRCGQFSEPLCKTTQLYEEPPSEAPNIACTNDKCPTSYDDQFRNVTVTWKLPAKTHWGGILREIKLRYHVTSSNSTFEEIVVKNTSQNNVTVQHLNKTLDYTINLQVCNRAGCSGFSNPLLVYGIRAEPNSIFSNERYWYIGGSIGGLVIVITVIVISSKVCYKEPRQTSNLETLGEESIPYYTEPSLKGEYGQLDREDCDELYMDNSNHDATQTVPSFE